MVLNTKNYNLENNLETVSSEFEIAANAKMFEILSAKIYEDPIRAIIRELSCNAIDANIEANNNENFNIYFPTDLNLSLIIEDNGIGMTHDDVMTVYKSYGKSTKSNNNNVIGALGLGGKTPLAYTSQFTLTTSKEGSMRSYIIYKDENGIPNVTLVSEKETDRTGTSVEVIVKEENIREFYRAAIKTFLFFDKMPNIMRGETEFYDMFKNFVPYSKREKDLLKPFWKEVREFAKADYIGGKSLPESDCYREIIKSYGSEYGVIMGQIFYGVNETQILDEKYKKISNKLLDFPNTTGTTLKKVLHIDMGAVDFQPSRETLSYNKNTINTLRTLFYAHYENWLTELSGKLNTPQKFLKNYNKVDNAHITSHGFLEGTAAWKYYKDTVSYAMGKIILNKSILADDACYYAREHKQSHQMMCIGSNVKTYSDVSDSSTIREFFNKIMNGQIKYGIILDEEKLAAQTQTFSLRTIAKGKQYGTMPAAVRTKITLLPNRQDDLFIVSEKIGAVIKKLFPTFILKKSSELQLPKETVARQKREKTERNNDCVVYNYMDGKNKILEAQVLKIAAKEIVTYECFEGNPNERGWWFTPEFSKLALNSKLNKNAAIRIDEKGRVESSKFKINSLNKIRGVIPVPTHHFLIDYKFFKKNNIQFNSNWVHAPDYAMSYLNNNFDNISDNLLNQFNLYGSSLLTSKENAEKYLHIGSNWVDFNNTAFGKECERKITEAGVPEVARTKIREAYEKIFNVVKENGSHSLHAELQPKFFALSKKIDNLNSERIDFKQDLYNLYPMISFAFDNAGSSGISNSISITKIVSYIANIEGLDEK